MVNRCRPMERSAFETALAITSLFGAVALALSSFTDFINIAEFQTSVLLIVLGSAIMLQGQILTMKRWIRDGVQGQEFTWLITVIVGLVIVIAGVLKLPFFGIADPRLDAYLGLAAIIVAIFIAIQTWVVKR